MNVVPRLWVGDTVVLLASGPSLTQEDCDAVRGKARVIAINRTIELAPWADALYCADAKMWKWLRGAPTFDGLKYGAEARVGQVNVVDYGVTVLKVNNKIVLSQDSTTLAHGRNSGYQAVNLAVLLGARRIVLLGYDFQSGPHGEKHWHADHPQDSRPDFQRWIEMFERLAPAVAAAGVDLVNATRQTSLRGVRRASLAESLSGSAVAA